MPKLGEFLNKSERETLNGVGVSHVKTLAQAWVLGYKHGAGKLHTRDEHLVCVNLRTAYKDGYGYGRRGGRRESSVGR